MSVVNTPIGKLINFKNTLYAFNPRANIYSHVVVLENIKEYFVIVDDGYHYPVTFKAVDRRDMMTMIRVLDALIN